MESSNLTIVLAVFFIVFAIVSSLIYYFARYYFKTDEADQELLTKKPVELGRTDKVDLNQALIKTREGLWGRLARLTFRQGLTSEVRDEIEEILYTSDLGPHTAEKLLAEVSKTLSGHELGDIESVRNTLRAQMSEIFKPVQPIQNIFERLNTHTKPTVWMLVGVNGVGKTTTIGKLASLAQANGLKALIVAGDTFRAAADSQLKVWAERRTGSEIFNPENVKDPSAVAYAGLERAKALGVDLVLVDTAGRLHTQEHLMEELKKMKRVMTKVLSDAPQERLLVIDANAGQNALVQAREFHQAVDLTGTIITKMDGSSKAGVALGIAHELKVPITYIGIGESVEDLRPFDAQAFVEAII